MADILQYSSVHQVSDGGYIISSSTNSFGLGLNDMYLLKVNSLGTVMWSKTYGSSNIEEYCRSIPTNDGGYIIVGGTYGFGAGNEDVCLIKTDSSGNVTWQKTYGSVGYESGFDIQQTNDGGFIIAGGTGQGSLGQIYVIKTNSTGILQWSKYYGGGYATSIKETNNGGYVIGGHTTNLDICLIKTDVNGNSCIQTSVNSITGNSAFGAVPAPFQISYGGIVNSGNLTVHNGTSTNIICFNVGIEQYHTLNNNENIDILPNPNSGDFEIKYELPNNQHGILEIFNALGNRIKIYNLPQNSFSKKLIISDFPQGVYCCLINSFGKTIFKKFLIR